MTTKQPQQALTSKEQNRKDFPFAAARMDEARKLFGPHVKLIWAKEGDREIGKREPD